MPWTPPTELLPITAPVYAQLRIYIDAGSVVIRGYAEARDNGCKSTEEGGKGCWPDVPVANALPKMAELLYRYVPAAEVSLEAAQKFAATYFPDQPEYFADTDAARLGWPTFVDREQLIKALDAVTPPEVAKEIGTLDRPPDTAGAYDKLPSANTDDAGLGLAWWTYALSAGGVLSKLGKTPAILAAIFGPGKKIKAIVVLASWVFVGLGLAGALDAVLPGLKKITKQVLVDPAAKAANIIAIAAGIGGAVLIGAIVYTVVNKQKQKQQRALAA